MSAAKHAVFVYGTLKRGFKNYAKCIEGKPGAEFSGTATTEAKWPMFVDAYGIPYVVNQPGLGSRIQGEIFEVDETTFAALDVLEGYPGRYTRLQIPVEQGGVPRTAWMYMLLAMEKLSSFALIDDYTLDFHTKSFVNHPDRDPSRKREWGGYE
ncbi:putative gamma-glutamylcyclotransferase [Diplonema papillatum]|nr:putative gamma-glutamylcyclotransferase [Diplonema papillatum]|eukprot:gene21148-32577_t